MKSLYLLILFFPSVYQPFWGIYFLDLFGDGPEANRRQESGFHVQAI